MKYMKYYENEEKIKYLVLCIPKNNIIELEKKTVDLEELNIKFKVFDSGKRNAKYYYIVSPDLNSYNYYLDEYELETLGAEVDYKTLIVSTKYNL